MRLYQKTTPTRALLLAHGTTKNHDEFHVLECMKSRNLGEGHPAHFWCWYLRCTATENNYKYIYGRALLPDERQPNPIALTLAWSTLQVDFLNHLTAYPSIFLQLVTIAGSGTCKRPQFFNTIVISWESAQCVFRRTLWLHWVLASVSCISR